MQLFLWRFTSSCASGRAADTRAPKRAGRREIGTYYRGPQKGPQMASHKHENMQNDISNGFVSCRVASTQCDAFATLQFMSLSA